MECREVMADSQNCYVSVPLIPLNSNSKKMESDIWAKICKFLYSNISVKLQKKQGNCTNFSFSFSFGGYVSESPFELFYGSCGRVCTQTAKNVVAIRNVDATPKILQHTKREVK
jgi:hypothetical protein